jgi:hypothetical protein
MLLGEAGHGAGLALAGKRAASDRTPHRSGSAPYHSGRSQHWIKMKDPNAPAVKRKAEEDWGKQKWR